MKYKTIYDKKNDLIKNLNNLKQYLEQPESRFDNPIIDCSIDITSDIKKITHKLCQKTIKITLTYKENRR